MDNFFKPRHTCIYCRKKRFEDKMLRFGQHWACTKCVTSCANNTGALQGEETDQPTGRKKIRVLNLYAGVGGNRFKWPDNLEVTAVELNPLIAAEYRHNFPLDHVIIGDAHSYLLKNFQNFDIIWTSPPCQTHSKMNFKFEKKRYIDLSLYQEIILLSSFFKGKFVVENVKPFYVPLVPAQFEICRHLFWTNVAQLTQISLPPFPPEYRGRYKGITIMPRKVICDWLGIPAGPKNIYIAKNAEQVYRNCVHPLLGQSIMNDILQSMK